MPAYPYVRTNKNRPVGPFLLLIIFFITGGLVIYLYPSFVHIRPDTELHLIIDDTDIGENKADVIQGEVFLPVEIVQEYLDPEIYWEEDTGRVIVTTKNKVVRMATEEISARVNAQDVSLQAPVIEKNGRPWIPIEFLAQLYRIDVCYYSDTQRVVIISKDRERQQGRVLTGTKLRTAPGFRNPWLVELQPGEKVEVFAKENGYYLARTSRGILGYLPQGDVAVRIISRPYPVETEQKPVLWQPPEGKRINLTWEFVVKRNPDTGRIPALPGVNVVAPTWFHLNDTAGSIANRASSSYVSWAHRRGYQVWALFSNGFNKEITHAVLSSAEKREKVIDQLLIYAELYDLDGINIDFENVYLQDGPLFVQFVRELVPLAHQQGLVVSVDVTVKGGSPNYSLFYDREALGEIADYVILMTYDEHWAGSSEAGSVASLPWVEKGVLGLLEEVPREKLILGVPFYTRLWIETEHDNGSVSVKSRALSMEQAEELLERKGAEVVFDEAAGQHYATWREGKVTYEIWLENETSMRQRVQLVNKYDLAGIASWRRGFEKDEIWYIIKEELNRSE